MARARGRETSILVHLLVCLFGIGSWVAVNGVWNELPIMVQHLPEKWNLPSYMAAVIQLANVGPVVLALANVLTPMHVHERFVIAGLVTTGAASCLLLSFFWLRTSVVAGRERSTALLALQFFIALVDCTSSVAFFPFMARFKPAYLTSFFVGKGLSGLLPSLLALGQNVGSLICLNATGNVISQGYEEPNFPIRYFLLFPFAMMVVCAGSFLLLNYLPHCKNEMVKRGKGEGPRRSGRPLIVKRPAAGPDDVECPDLTNCHYGYLLFLIVLVNFLSNGALPSIQSYSCLPYGSKAYHLSVSLGSMTNPLACFLAFFLPTSSTAAITLVTIIGFTIGSYQLFLAAASPHPPLQGQVVGSVILISSWMLVTALLSYAKVCVASIVRKSRGRSALLWYGGATQLGSFAGAVLMFLLVNIYSMFVGADPCSL